jgi:hypothetical protein
LPPGRYAALVQTLEARRELVRLGGKDSSRLIHAARLAALAEVAMKRIRNELKAHQPRRTLPRRTLLDVCRNLMAPELLEPVFAHLVQTKQLAAVGENLGPADAQFQLSKNQLAIREKLLHAIAQGKLMPPTTKELAASLGQRLDTIASLCTVSAEEGLLVEVAAELFYAPAAIEEARSICAATLNRLGAATMSQLREAWGISRKYSVPLCEYLDAQRDTIREGDLRKAGTRLAPAKP